jgi:phosphoglucosamine mutase
MEAKLFGTDGIRAAAGNYPLNSATVVAIGQAIGETLGGRILVGQDTRISSPWIFELLSRGIQQTSAGIEDAGVIPTPAIALLTKEYAYSGGVMISASHNPYGDNGIKVFASDGRKLSDADEAAIERRVNEIVNSRGAGDFVDTIPDLPISAENATVWPHRYVDLLLSHFSNSPWLRGMRIVVDCAHGAMTCVAPALLEKLGAELLVINASPTGRNINNGCGAVHLESLRAALHQRAADFGVAFDGDGDRSLFISGTGRLLDGDAVLLLMARRLKARGTLNPAMVIGTQMTNFSLERMLAHEHVSLTRVAVGDRFIFEEMLRSGAMLGGEPSGHIIFSDFRLSGDGLLTTLKVAQAIVDEQASFDDLTRDWIPAPQLLRGVRVRQRIALEAMPAVQAKIAEVEHQLRGRGRVVVRYSGTEPLLRIMIESDDARLNEQLMEEMLAVVGAELLG